MYTDKEAETVAQLKATRRKMFQSFANDGMSKRAFEEQTKKLNRVCAKLYLMTRENRYYPLTAQGRAAVEQLEFDQRYPRKRQ